MFDGTVLQEWQETAEVVEQALRPIRLAKHKSDLACLLEGLTATAAILVDTHLTKYHKLLELAWSAEIEDYNQTGQRFQSVLDEEIGVFRDVLYSCQSYAEASYPIPSATRLGDLVGQLQVLRDRITASWPWVDEAEFNESLERERSGVKFKSSKEVHDELRRRLRHPG